MAAPTIPYTPSLYRTRILALNPYAFYTTGSGSTWQNSAPSVANIDMTAQGSCSITADGTATFPGAAGDYFIGSNAFDAGFAGVAASFTGWNGIGWSVSFWANFVDSSLVTLFDMQNGGDSTRLRIWLNNALQFRYHFALSNDDAGHLAVPGDDRLNNYPVTPSLASAVFQRYTMVWHEDETRQFYAGNELVVTATTGHGFFATPGFTDWTSPWELGRAKATGITGEDTYANMNGYLRDFAIWNRCLTHAEVMASGGSASGGRARARTRARGDNW